VGDQLQITQITERNSLPLITQITERISLPLITQITQITEWIFASDHEGRTESDLRWSGRVEPARL